MCAIVGALLGNVGEADLEKVNKILGIIMINSRERGRDGWGYTTLTENGINVERAVPEQREIFNGAARQSVLRQWDNTFFEHPFQRGSFIANLRAEPTTEYVQDKSETDQQPYIVRPWAVVHNGTIANDKDLRNYRLRTKIDSASIPEYLSDMGVATQGDDHKGLLHSFSNAISHMQGSYAILAIPTNDPSKILTAANYRPIWYITTKYGFFFASSRSYFPSDWVPQMLMPYSNHLFGIDSRGVPYHKTALHQLPCAMRALVVCSGGLDSTVAAADMLRRGYTVELIHFQYGSRAEGPEVRAVNAIADELGVKCTLFPLPVYKPEDSPLLRADSTIAGGEEGAEFAHEWVPARNLLLLSVATAYAEANGFDVLVLGNNLEEAGAYPDNEPEFIHRFNDLLPFAVGDGKSLHIQMPVGNMMKHEIVALGHQILAPLHLTWSCYRAGEQHCGTCGPCFMRRTAFKINNMPEVISYEKETV